MCVKCQMSIWSVSGFGETGPGETDKCEIYMFTERLKKELDDSEWPQNLSSIFDTDDFNLICTILIAWVETCFHFLFVWPCLAVCLCVCPCVGLSALLCTTIMCTTIICQAYVALDKTCSNCLCTYLHGYKLMSLVCDSVRYVVLNKNNTFVCLL